ncbi:MAG: hypothetical protein IJB16_03120, partial [Clostridia bacterium]|nr:hypothetical protein [Clostridia bacterium]
RLMCRGTNTVMAVAREFNPISLLIYSAKRFKPYLINSYSIAHYYNLICWFCQYIKIDGTKR